MNHALFFVVELFVVGDHCTNLVFGDLLATLVAEKHRKEAFR